MSESEAASFLASMDSGVLSLAVDDRAYGFPIAFTYDGDTDRIVLGFVAGPESTKDELAAATETATFTVYSQSDVDSWLSVIATGRLNPLDDDVEHHVPDLFYRQNEGRIVNLDQFERTWYGLEIDSLSGRHSGD